MDVVVRRISDAISVPSKGVFTRGGNPIVYVRTDKTYRPVRVEVLARNPDEVAIKGIPEGAQVALVEPDGKG
jgi:HlyD family secretion protein